MKTRGLAEFRAEHNIWRKDLAEMLNIRETELERLEMLGEVPPHIKQVLLAEYNLPDTYFTEDMERAAVLQAAAQRYEPKNPLLFFGVVGAVWLLAVGLIYNLIALPGTIASIFGFQGNAALFSAVETVCCTVVGAVSGIYLGSYLLKKTNFRGELAAYEFLYPLLPMMAAAWVQPLVSQLLGMLFMDETGQITSVGSLIFISSIALLLAAALEAGYLAYLLDAAARAPGKEKQKRLMVLCGISLGGYLLYHIVQMLLGGYFLVDGTVWVVRVLALVLRVLVLYGILYGVRKQPKLKSFWLTALPLAALLLPTALELLITAFAG